MERSKRNTGLIIAVVVLAAILVVALLMHYANTGRFFPSMHEVKNDVTEAGDRITDDARIATNDANNALKRAENKDTRNYTTHQSGTGAVIANPETTITHYPETQIIR